MKLIYTNKIGFNDELNKLLDRETFAGKHIIDVVEGIVNDVAINGNSALFKYTAKFDKISLNEGTIEVSRDEINEALEVIDSRDLEIFEIAARRIEKFHKRQLIESWSDVDEDGIELGQVIRPLNRIGIYAPGGLAPYPSTVLMAAIPAKVAGVKEIILTTPSKEAKVNPHVLAAAKLGGVDRVFKIGGAQAIAALAYGTESVPPVDKIVGPGNIYVAIAKKMVYGKVGIDMIAGPSEIVIISDGMASPSVTAADLLSQAEHDEMASAILLTPVKEFALKVVAEVDLQMKELSRSSIASKSIEQYGAVIVTKDMEEAIDISNRIAPEHLELMTENPKEILTQIKNAGAVFLGNNTPEVLGDYMAGPNHILPTAGTARYSSPLGVYDFVKRINIMSFPEKILGKYVDKVSRFAEIEGLDAHAKSIKGRIDRKKP